MQIHEANLKRNGNWSHRSGTSEIILHHAEASHASVEDINQASATTTTSARTAPSGAAVRNGRSARTRRGTTTSPSASAARALT
mgnify:CR=1 FL=1